MDVVIVAARVVLSLAAVLGLLLFLQRRLTKGTTRTRKANPLSVVARTGVGSKASVVVVEVDGRRFLLGVTEQNIAVLHSAATAADAPASPAAVESVRSTQTSDGMTVDDEFERLLADAALDSPAALVSTDAVQSAPALSPREATGRANHRAQVAGGSILSRETWRATAAFLRQDR
ncbi:MAG: flagellar biosynthetic protein FliO [Leifsonia sp.]